MDWWKEVSKGFINLSVVTVAVLVYGSLTHLQGRFLYAVIGLVLVPIYAHISYRFWKRGD